MSSYALLQRAHAGVYSGARRFRRANPNNAVINQWLLPPQDAMTNILVSSRQCRRP